jgi:hypothetical protein
MWVTPHFPNVGPSITNYPSQTSDIVVKATSCNVLIQHDMALLSGSNTICNDPKKSANYNCAITTKELVNLEFLQNSI